MRYEFYETEGVSSQLCSICEMRRPILLFQRNKSSIRSAWVGQKQVEQCAILLILLLEVVSVRLRVPLQLKPERSMVGLELFQSAHFALHLQAGVSDAGLGRVAILEKTQLTNVLQNRCVFFTFSWSIVNGGFPR